MKDMLSNSEYKVIKPIIEGCSNDKKYYVETISGNKYLLRISDSSEYLIKKGEYEAIVKMGSFDVPLPRPIDFGYCDDGKSIYTLLEWIEGKDMAKCVSHLADKEQYSLGLKAGEILKNIHKYVPSNQKNDWSDRYYSVIKPRIEAYKTEGIAFDGSDKILDYIEDNRHLLRNRDQCRHHGDYHIGNMILTDENEINIIDWQTADFMNIGDPWYEFNRIDTRYPAFASGQIYGYFDGSIPAEFWRLFALYISASSITSIVWAKYFSPESMDEILNKNIEVLNWFENMENPVPSWFNADSTY